MKTITILPTGEVQFLGDIPPVDLPLGKMRRQRVSTILPLTATKRCAFKLLRLLFGERGRVAAWTRTWQCEWRVTILATRQSAVFETREDAIRWEIGILEASYDHQMLELRVEQ